MAPENGIRPQFQFRRDGASMRPGLDGPGKRQQGTHRTTKRGSFNEAGAGWPRKTSGNLTGDATGTVLQ